jgi:hypothetical protein
MQMMARRIEMRPKIKASVSLVETEIENINMCRKVNSWGLTH